MTMFVQLATVQAKERMTVLLAINAKELVAIQNSTGMTIMSKQIDALKLAFEALKENQHLVADNERHAYVMEYNSIIEKCEEALAQPEQEPVAWQWCGEAHFRKKIPKHSDISDWSPLYRTPQRTWVGLTDEEHNEIAIESGCMSADWVFYGAAVERKVKEKNT